MRTTLLVAVACVLGAASRVDAGSRLKWKYDGYHQLPAAALEAKRTNKRLLIGLSGSNT